MANLHIDTNWPSASSLNRDTANYRLLIKLPCRPLEEYPLPGVTYEQMTNTAVEIARDSGCAVLVCTPDHDPVFAAYQRE